MLQGALSQLTWGDTACRLARSYELLTSVFLQLDLGAFISLCSIISVMRECFTLQIGFRIIVWTFIFQNRLKTKVSKSVIFLISPVVGNHSDLILIS